MDLSFKIVEIDDNSWYIEKVGRAFLFRGEKAALLVDTTKGPGDLLREVKRLSGDLPIILVNTHGDNDHIGCNGQFETAYMHPCEFAYYSQHCKPGDAVPAEAFEGKVFDIGGREFEVILLPGHTYGSIALLNRKERFLVGGDSILQRVFIFGPQRNLRALLASLKRLKCMYASSFDKIYGAHFEFPLDTSFIDDEISCGEALLAGELEVKEAGNIPLEAPDFKPAGLYTKGRAGMFYYRDPE